MGTKHHHGHSHSRPRCCPPCPLGFSWPQVTDRGRPVHLLCAGPLQMFHVNCPVWWDGCSSPLRERLLFSSKSVKIKHPRLKNSCLASPTTSLCIQTNYLWAQPLGCNALPPHPPCDPAGNRLWFFPITTLCSPLPGSVTLTTAYQKIAPLLCPCYVGSCLCHLLYPWWHWPLDLFLGFSSHLLSVGPPTTLFRDTFLPLSLGSSSESSI